ncbi:hypothetical protein SAMN02745903_01930 [Pseudomonas sp. URMO17WK12:I5]|nr:hypothetical protein H040_01995 [Pseudomonas sp. URMO17WK12:I7]SMF18480.1 hypothetical protein SAMN02745903_01930 [Pseudomonas sp. URMO17WK12:I5]
MLGYSRAVKYVYRALLVLTWFGKCCPVNIFVHS